MKKYVLMLSLVPVLALVVIGVGYGYWSETLDIDGTVSTTELSARWDNSNPLFPSCSEFYTLPAPGGLGEPFGMNVASTTPTWVNDNLVTIQLNNVYPGYGAQCNLRFVNDSPLLHVLGKGIKLVADTGLTGCTPSSTIIVGSSSTVMDCNELKLEFSDGVGTNFAPGDMNTDSIVITVKEGANPSATYTFHAQTCVSQTTDPGNAADCFNSAPINP